MPLHDSGNIAEFRQCPAFSCITAPPPLARDFQLQRKTSTPGDGYVGNSRSTIAHRAPLSFRRVRHRRSAAATVGSIRQLPVEFQETVGPRDTTPRPLHVGILRWIGASRRDDPQFEYQVRHRRNRSDDELKSSRSSGSRFAKTIPSASSVTSAAAK